ncbi:MAG: DUF1016 family protein [Bacteroidales bacterium]|nr:DUF1016 family protein [Bacteroidales bacterium]
MDQTDNMLDFEGLAQHICNASEALRSHAAHAINRDTTTRAWLTGYYIVEYEQHGSDRAKYGEGLIKKLASRLDDNSLGVTYLKNARLLYLVYPQLGAPVKTYLTSEFGKSHSSSGQLLLPLKMASEKSHSSSDLSLQPSADELSVPSEVLFSRLSLTHLVRLTSIKDSLQRTFYELSAISGVWSVKELERQMKSNYYIRSGWSAKPEKLKALVNAKATKRSLREDLKSPFVFEFLGLASKDVWEESDLEQSIIDHLQEFILEMGKGFCFEARQKKILIDDDYHKIDLVFYNRIFKAHCLVELKAHQLDYADVAQLNMYLNYYRKNEMQLDDNPPVGILMCTEVGAETAEYTTAGLDQQLFISKYELQLPSPEKITAFLRQENSGKQ